MSLPSLIEMLKYCRPEGSETQKAWCKRFLEPTFGKPDQFGNYIHIIPQADGTIGPVAFLSHSDTVHHKDGMQNVWVFNDMIMSDSNCLGADDTTGCWLILGMIEVGTPGVYVIHAGEEIGCRGSRQLVSSKPYWLSHIKAAISFDRKGYSSIITKQLGRRTASDAFAESFAAAVDMDLKADPTGAYTDSNEYADVVSECTNISVGYFGQHSSKEEQDISFAYKLLSKLQRADWSKLVFERVAEPDEDLGWPWWNNNTVRNKGLLKGWDYSDSEEVEDLYSIEDLVRDYPEEIAEMLKNWGMTAYGIQEELDSLDANKYLNRQAG